MRFHLLLLVSIIVVSWKVAVAESSALTPFIDKTALTARVSAAIAIQNGIVAEKSLVIEATAEFLNAPKDVISGFLKPDFDRSGKNLQVYLNSLDDIHVSVKNSGELIDALKLLMAMKSHEQYLKPGAVQDPSAQYKTTLRTVMDVARDNGDLLKTVELLETKKALQLIVGKSGDQVDSKVLRETLVKLKEHSKTAYTRIKNILAYENDIREFLRLETLKDDLKVFVKLVNLANNYSTTFKKIDSYRADLESSSADSGKMRSSIEKHQKYSKEVQELSKSPILNVDRSTPSEKRLTSGILNYAELKTVDKDLSDDWFKKNVLEVENAQKLKEALNILKRFLSGLDGVSGGWNSFSSDLQSKEAAKSVIESITNIFSSGEVVLGIPSSESPFVEVSKCIKSLNSIKNTADPVKFKAITDFADTVAINIKSLNTVMKKLIGNGLEATQGELSNIFDIVFPLKANDNDTQAIEFWNKIRGVPNLKKTLSSIESITVALASLNSESVFNVPQIDYDVIASISHIFDGTNVQEVMNCINPKSVQNLVETFNFVANTAALKTKQKEFKTTIDYFQAAASLQKGLQKIVDDTKKTKLAPGEEALQKFAEFKNIEIVAEKCGGSVQSLRALENVAKMEKSIQSIVNAGDNVKALVAKIKGSDVVYTVEIRNDLEKTLNKVKEIQKTAASIPHNTLREISQFLSKMSKTVGLVQLKDPSFFKEIGRVLAKDSMPESKLIAKDFEAIGSMDLDFAKHKSRFGAASDAFSQFQKSIRSFLREEKDNNPDESVGENKEETGDHFVRNVVIGCVVVAIFIIAVSFAFCYYRGVCLWSWEEIPDDADLEANGQKSDAKTEKKSKDSLNSKKRPKRRRVIFYKKKGHSTRVISRSNSASSGSSVPLLVVSTPTTIPTTPSSYASAPVTNTHQVSPLSSPPPTPAAAEFHKKLLDTQERVHKLREHNKNLEEQRLKDTDPKNYENMGLVKNQKNLIDFPSTTSDERGFSGPIQFDSRQNQIWEFNSEKERRAIQENRAPESSTSQLSTSIDSLSGDLDAEVRRILAEKKVPGMDGTGYLLPTDEPIKTGPRTGAEMRADMFLKVFANDPNATKSVKDMCAKITEIEKKKIEKREKEKLKDQEKRKKIMMAAKDEGRLLEKAGFYLYVPKDTKSEDTSKQSKKRD